MTAGFEGTVSGWDGVETDGVEGAACTEEGCLVGTVEALLFAVIRQVSPSVMA